MACKKSEALPRKKLWLVREYKKIRIGWIDLVINFKVNEVLKFEEKI
jgi:hypothetical protein